MTWSNCKGDLKQTDQPLCMSFLLVHWSSFTLQKNTLPLHPKRNSAGTSTQGGPVKHQILQERRCKREYQEDFFLPPYLVCGPELCVCATRIGVTSRLFPLCEKTDFVPAWLILLTVCITQSFYRFVIMSLRSLNLCYTKSNPFCLSNTAQRRINIDSFNKG